MAFSGDDSRCPICGEKNNCASVQDREIEKCWCMQEVFTP
ncbi:MULTISPECIES: cysteine-rich CWC family protein [unclassified Priestia]